MSLLDSDVIAERIAAMKAAAAEQDHSENRYRYIRPLAEAAEGLIEYALNPDGRFMTGIEQLDVMTRGFGKGELVYVGGASHSGKTTLILNSVLNNPDARVVWFTPDEVAELVFMKLVALRESMSGEDIERRIREGDTALAERVREIARTGFPNLYVIDAGLGFEEMADAVTEAKHAWGAECDLVVIDYLGLVPLAGSGDSPYQSILAKSVTLKRWTKHMDVPVVCLHQASRSSGSRGKGAGITALTGGGENEATFVIEVFRKREDEALDQWEKELHQNTITMNLAKNKRPPCKVGVVDLFLDPMNGHIRRLRDEDMGVRTTGIQSAAGALAAHKGWSQK